MEIGVRVGGLPKEVFRVSGTSVVHYEVIRRGKCAAVSVGWVGDVVWKEKEPPHVVCIFSVDAWLHVVAVVCLCVRVRGEETLPVSLNLLKQQKARSPRTLSMVAFYPYEHGTCISSLQMLTVRYRPRD